MSSTPSFCIGWRDTYSDEQRFLITLKYLNSGEEFRYITPPNTNQLYVPVSEAPTTASFEQCTARKDFQIEVQAIRPTAATSVGQMAGEGECRH
ncbi:MAG: hypothetical protein H0X37_07335 [Herpetosiphonaceae bacterium]|nr:hypothetical protein [Herpetosiphonaceae bacterium]